MWHKNKIWTQASDLCSFVTSFSNTPLPLGNCVNKLSATAAAASRKMLACGRISGGQVETYGRSGEKMHNKTRDLELEWIRENSDFFFFLLFVCICMGLAVCSLSLYPWLLVILFLSLTVYHDIESKFKRTTLRMKKQNEGVTWSLNILIC